MTTGFYPPMARSPVTELSAGIDNAQTTIGVVNVNALPAAPNTATIGGGADSETIKYTGKAGSDLTDCIRGFDPAGSAKAWDSGTIIKRVMTAQDLKALQDAVSGHVADTTTAHGAVSAATADKIMIRDAAGRAKVVAPDAAEDIALLGSITKTQVGLANVTNDAQLPIAGGTMTGVLYPQNNTSYTTGQARRIILSTGDPNGGDNGDVWLKYTA